MIITATDFQLSVNEYFTKIMQGEEIIVERYGKKFAVLVPYEEYISTNDQIVPSESTESESEEKLELDGLKLSQAETMKLIKLLLSKV
jgi:PHD/YefM family antitoxin component YafN of YafNO toxin-antitoxin module